MNTLKVTLEIFRMLLFLALLAACTENPFGDDEITGDRKQISGRVMLEDGASPEGNEQLVVCKNPVVRRLTFTLSKAPFAPGQYEAIPYLLVDPPGVPQPLLAKLGESINQLNVNYLRKPMRREDGGFEVKN